MVRKRKMGMEARSPARESLAVAALMTLLTLAGCSVAHEAEHIPIGSLVGDAAKAAPHDLNIPATTDDQSFLDSLKGQADAIVNSEGFATLKEQAAQANETLQGSPICTATFEAVEDPGPDALENDLHDAINAQASGTQLYASLKQLQTIVQNYLNNKTDYNHAQLDISLYIFEQMYCK